MANWQTSPRLATGSSKVSSQNFISGMTKKPKVPERTYTSRPRPEVGQDPALGPALGVGSPAVPNRGNVWSRNQTMPGKDPALNGLAQAQQSVTPPAGRTIFGMDSNKFARFAGSMGAAIAPGTGGGRLGAAVAGIAQDNIEKDYKSQELKNRQDFLERGRKANQESTEGLQEKRFENEKETTKSKREHEANLLKDQIERDKDKRDLDLKLKKAQIKNLGKEKTTTLTSNYNTAVANGYKGTLAEWKALGSKGTSNQIKRKSDLEYGKEVENNVFEGLGYQYNKGVGWTDNEGKPVSPETRSKGMAEARRLTGLALNEMNKNPSLNFYSAFNQVAGKSGQSGGKEERKTGDIDYSKYHKGDKKPPGQQPREVNAKPNPLSTIQGDGYLNRKGRELFQEISRMGAMAQSSALPRKPH